MEIRQKLLAVFVFDEQAPFKVTFDEIEIGRNGADGLNTSKSMVVLIDLEFAGLNNPLFDLASVIGENDMTDLPLIETFLKDYYGRAYNPVILHKALQVVAMVFFLRLPLLGRLNKMSINRTSLFSTKC